jgi:DNA polymerase-3 subunit alpha
MEKFAGYGFNKSHAAAYALLAYHTAWLKAHHPAEFMAANMSLAMDDTDKVKILFEDCIANKMAVLPPDINMSAYRFEPVAEADGKRSRTIRYGLGAIKGSGQNAIEEILRAREEGKFVDLFDFCNRIDRRIVNRRTIEALIRAGAFDSLHENRAQLIASVSLAMEAADQASANAMQAGLFDMGDAPSQGHELIDEPAWPEKRRLQEEKTALGFYLSGHLFDAYKDEVRRFVRQKIGELKEGRDKLVAGVIVSLRTQMTQRGKMLIALLDDGTGQCEVTVFNEQFEAHKQLFKEDELLVVQGQARNDAFTGGIRFTVDTPMDLGRARTRYAQAVKVQMNGNANALVLRSVLEAYRAKPEDAEVAAPAPAARGGGRGGFGGNGDSGGRGQRPSAPMPNGLAVQIVYRSDNAEGEVRLGDAWRVKPTDELLAALRSEFSGSAIEIVY